VTDGRLDPPGGWDAGDAGGGYRYAIRVGLADVRGITDDEVASLLEGRPFTCLEDVRRRAALSRPTAEHLARSGGFDHVCGVGRLVQGRASSAGGRGAQPYRLTRRDVLLAVEELWGSSRSKQPAPASQQTSLDLDAEHVPMLPEQTEADVVRDELQVLQLDVTRHVLDFYAPLLEELGVVESNQLHDQPDTKRVRVAGVKVAVQSPPVKSGQRVLFLSLDDRTSTSQVTYFERVLDDCAWTILHAWLLVAEGRVRKRGAKGVTVTGDRVWDLSRLWRAWQEGWLPDALQEKGTPSAHQQHDRTSRPPGLHAAEFGRGSR
jgi:error-prone DNA polymerase